MFIYKGSVYTGPRQAGTGVGHRFGERDGLFVVEPADEDKSEQGRCLRTCDCSVDYAIDKGANLGCRQRQTIAFPKQDFIDHIFFRGLEFILRVKYTINMRTYLLPFLCLLLTSCSGSETCGTGTVLVDGVCVVADDSGSGDADTDTDADTDADADTDSGGAVCGNSIVEQGEQCDDGNTATGDGCGATCQTEGGGSTDCGNGTVDAGETCDDGNTTPGDGCDSFCQTEGGGSTNCGNGTIDAGENCDDGNTTNGDGCDSFCVTEPDPDCGNNRLDADEECDDGNNDPGDGCSPNCKEELCGNGAIDGPEECDDGNTADGDGCSGFCKDE